MKKNIIKTLSLFLLLSNITLQARSSRKNKQKENNVSSKTKGFSRPSFSFFKKKTHETVSLSQEIASSGATINLKNINGCITVKTWEKKCDNPNRAPILIDAYKSGTEEAVKGTRISAKNNTHTLTLATLYDTESPCTVDYTLVVPKGCSLNLETVNGEINVFNNEEKVVARTTNGMIALNNVSGIIETATQVGSISITASDVKDIFAFADKGKINLNLPPKTNAKLFAETKSGIINSDVEITSKPRRMKLNKRTYAQLKKETTGVIGEGSNITGSIKLKTNRGNITLNEA